MLAGWNIDVCICVSMCVCVSVCVCLLSLPNAKCIKITSDFHAWLLASLGTQSGHGVPHGCWGNTSHTTRQPAPLCIISAHSSPLEPGFELAHALCQDRHWTTQTLTQGTGDSSTGVTPCLHRHPHPLHPFATVVQMSATRVPLFFISPYGGSQAPGAGASLWQELHAASITLHQERDSW